MIKIIKRGTKKEQECEKCGCVFSYDDTDIIVNKQVSYSDFRMGHYKKYIKCPQCNYIMLLEASK